MLCCFISKKTFSIIGYKEVESYDCSLNLDYGGKTKINVAGDPTAADEDFVILKDGNDVKFQGIVESIENEDGGRRFAVSCLEIERCFDRQITISDTNIIREQGLEDFVCHTIRNYFSESGDDFIDMNYISCQVLTHTRVNSKPSGENGIYNFKTYLGNIKEQYGIFLDFEFDENNLIITIHNKEQSNMQIDTTITDVVKCIENYKVKVLAKLNVVWINSLTQAKSNRTFYLHSDRTVSEINADRVDGTVSTISIEAETEAEMIQEARNEFKSNSYSHAIEASILSTSKLYPSAELYCGHAGTIKTSAAGIKESIISAISFSSESKTILVKFGILKVTLTDKLK